MHVYVLDRHGQPLMPCRPRKARKLLDARKAHIVRRTPFTIQLDYETSNKKQHVVLGIDAGSKTIGISASTEGQELFSAELNPRNDVVRLLSTRRELRRSRRKRKTRYRPARFDNRTHSKHKGWLAPSVKTKIHNHIQAVELVLKILPINELVVETAEFDLQRLKAMETGDPLPVGTDYQLGETYDYYNVRQYVLHRDDYRCRNCKANKDVKFHVHHLESRKTGGNRPDNLVTLCKTCHEKVHKGLIDIDKLKKGRNYRDASFMGVMRKTLMLRLREKYSNLEIHETHGYITKYIREKHKLSKLHTTDALCIAGHPTATKSDRVYHIKPFRSHNRCLHKANPGRNGVRRRNQSAKTVKSFKLFDKVKYQGTTCFIWGKRTSGNFMLKTLDGTTIHNSASYKKLTLLERNNSYIIS